MRSVEKQRSSLAERLEEAGNDHEALASIGTELGQADTELETLEERWLELSEELET